MGTGEVWSHTSGGALGGDLVHPFLLHVKKQRQRETKWLVHSHQAVAELGAGQWLLGKM